MNRWRARRQASENDEQGDRQVDGEDGDGETRRWKMEGARVCVCVSGITGRYVEVYGEN